MRTFAKKFPVAQGSISRFWPRSTLPCAYWLSSKIGPRDLSLCLLFCCVFMPVFYSALAQDAFSQRVALRVITVDSTQQADEVLRRLKAGEDFAVLAREKSTDATAEQGGLMGRLDPATLRPELREALKNLKPGQTSPAIKLSSGGYAILKLLPESELAKVPNAAPAHILPMLATGTIRYTPNLVGKSEADLAFRSFPKATGWNQDLQGLCEIRQKSVSGMIEKLSKSELINTARSPEEGAFDQIEAHYALANLYAFRGEMDQAISQWEIAYQIATKQLPGAMAELEEVLGIAYLHKSEMENGVYLHPGELCLFPPLRPFHYEKTAGSQKAVEYFRKYLERKPDALDVQWLLNLAYMTLGHYPEGVPSQFLISPSAFASKEHVGRFVDVATQTGISAFGQSSGVVVDDFENNGLLDVVVSDYGQCGSMHYFHNNGDGTFSDRSKESGLADQLGGSNVIQADYNNDGCLDILVLRGAWEFPQRKSLLRNNCNGTFTDVTKQSGLAEPATSTQAAVWADLDNDGLVDLVVGNENAPMQLFRNQGDGTFKDIAGSAGIARGGFSKAVVAADYDNDGFPDLYVSVMNGPHFLYHNNHNMTFSEVSAASGVGNLPWQGFSSMFFDYDNDGWPDLFVGSYYGSVEESIRSYLGLPPNAETPKLYRNAGNGKFTDVTKQVGLDKVFMPMGANFGDIDNDGYLDLYLGTGNTSYASLLPNVLLRNHDGKYFVDVTASSGTGELHLGHGVAFADLGNNGVEDLVEAIGGVAPGDAHALRVFANPGSDNDWISLHLIGVKTNRAAIGARIRVIVSNQNLGQRSIYRTVGSGGSFGASPLSQHIGLGKSAHIDELEVWWPTSNSHQVFTHTEKNRFLEITEFAKDYKQVNRPAFRLAGAGKQVAALQPK
jgi:tetratricopeptide (TPR) repeat protein